MATRTLLSGAALAVAAVACSDGAPTAPTSLVTVPAFSAADASAASFGVNDAAERLTLQIRDMEARATLRDQLEILSAAVNAGDAARAKTALARADRVLSALVAANDGRETLDVSAVRISLLDARALIEGIEKAPAEEAQ